MSLADKVCLITGGAAGIGRATVEKFVAQRATVVFCDLNEEAGKETEAAVGERATFARVDVTDRAAVQQWVDGAVAEHGRIDVLINNAGITRDNQLVKVKDGELVKQMPEADFDLVLDVNLKGVFNCAQAVAPVMIRQGSGVILNASSVVGLDGNFGQTNYVATKAGVVGMTKVWARELGRYGVRVNAVAPGFIMTEMTAKMPDRILEGMKSHTPLGRMGQPEDIANAYAFLASEQASFITGEVLRVDGGIVIGT
ncbi:MAG: beta-ketoacyl-ACP reductase [Anaerolineae bacterium]|nr:beta-ketoacyl-ACP reductase [Anaerolineae bacterium]